MVMMANETQRERQLRIFNTEFMPEIDALYNFAYHLTYSDSDANDLVQETYLKAFRFIDSYNAGTNAKAWLFRILKNVFINDYRKRSKQPNRVELDEVANYGNEENAKYAVYTDLNEELYNAMMGDEVTIALNTLPVDFKEVILLCDIEGFKYEEISEIVGIPIGTVRSRLHRARNMLKEQLKTYAASLGFQDKRAK